MASLTISRVIVCREVEGPLLVDGPGSEKREVEVPLLVDGPASLCLEGPGDIPALARADDNSDDVTGWRNVDAPLDAADDLDDWIRSSFAATSSA